VGGDKYPHGYQINYIRDSWRRLWSDCIQCPHNFCSYYLFKTFVDYREHEEIRLKYVTDATILIVMREIAAGVYPKDFVINLF
jgi:hypothetical protein